MERLTERFDGWVMRKGCHGPCRTCHKVQCTDISHMIDRFAAYEDTMSLERAQELAQAEKDGRLVVLPCKKGDTLWSYYNYPTRGISKIVVTAVSTLEGITVINTDNCGVIPEGDIGKTVFLAREEAEAALKKRDADNEKSNSDRL